MKIILLALLLSTATILGTSPALSQERYGGGDFRELVPTSPKEGWKAIEPTQVNEGSPGWSKVVLWLPNRVLDLFDIFRADVGIGPSFGAVVRVTKYGQVGYRHMAPASLRIGDFGRRMPFLVESSNEFGAGPGYVDSADRDICDGEVGVGADALVAGAYVGVCVDEVADFLAGLFFFDLKEDDL